MTQVTTRPQLTFKDNRGKGRHDWLRLTPAYSGHLVADLLAHEPKGPLLDPFAGTGTTVVTALEHGIAADGVDINPFLIWLCETKTSPYSQDDLAAARTRLDRAAEQADRCECREAWQPEMNNIENWWSEPALRFLGRLYVALGLLDDIESPPQRLVALAFCRTMIGCANVSFGHQSMSLRPSGLSLFGLVDMTREEGARLFASAGRAAPTTSHRFVLGDSRELPALVRAGHYRRIITSPPYANRISYLRELRPYMIWLRFLDTPQQAGDLDWATMGGTWGRATSNVAKWEPDSVEDIHRVFDHDSFEQIRHHSDVLARYVLKYFTDVDCHIANLRAVLSPGARVDYIVGNSKYYDTMVHTEQLYERLLLQHGFERTSVHVIRKRSSKKELYEYRVEAWLP